MLAHDAPLSHVSDTAFWVAQFRAEETEKPNALFQDPLAARLTGELGQSLAQKMSGAPQTRWTIVIRTWVIDQYITQFLTPFARLLSEANPPRVTVLNLGCGLDTRPYRMKLPPNLRWVEVDYPKTIEFKNKTLADQTPRCQLERISLDLANRTQRQELFAKINSESQHVLVLTEGVIPYLSETDVQTLAEDLRAHKNFRGWIAEYLAPQVYRHFQRGKRRREMKNAPFRFFPKDWFDFFSQSGWLPQETRYLAIEGEKLHRPFPMPFWSYPWLFAFGLLSHIGIMSATDFRKFSGYTYFIPKDDL